MAHVWQYDRPFLVQDKFSSSWLTHNTQGEPTKPTYAPEWFNDLTINQWKQFQTRLHDKIRECASNGWDIQTHWPFAKAFPILDKSRFGQVMDEEYFESRFESDIWAVMKAIKTNRAGELLQYQGSWQRCNTEALQQRYGPNASREQVEHFTAQRHLWHVQFATSPVAIVPAKLNKSKPASSTILAPEVISPQDFHAIV